MCPSLGRTWSLSRWRLVNRERARLMTQSKSQRRQCADHGHRPNHWNLQHESDLGPGSTIVGHFDVDYSAARPFPVFSRHQLRSLPMGHSLPPRYEIKPRPGYDARRLRRVFRVGEKSPADGYVVPSVESRRNASRYQMEERPHPGLGDHLQELSPPFANFGTCWSSRGWSRSRRS